MRLKVVLESGVESKKRHFMCSSFAFFNIYLVLLVHWTPGMTLQFSVHEKGHLVCIFFPLKSLLKEKFLLNGNRRWKGFLETTIIRENMNEPLKKLLYISHGVGGRLMTGKSLNTFPGGEKGSDIEYVLSSGQGQDLLMLRKS